MEISEKMEAADAANAAAFPVRMKVLLVSCSYEGELSIVSIQSILIFRLSFAHDVSPL
jgi:hypothetical protein